ncbi:MAG: EamA family transporter [archaeon]
MDLSLGIVFGLIAMAGFGLHTAISQVPIRSVGIVRTIFFRNIFTSSILLAGVLLFQQHATLSLKYVGIALAISFMGYIPLVMFFKALNSGKVGVVTPIANSSVIFTILFSILFFGESLSGVQTLSIALIVLGIVLISVDFGGLKNSMLLKVSSGVPYALVTSVLWGVVFFLFKIPVDVLGPILTAFVTEFGIMIFAAANMGLMRMKFTVPDKKDIRYIGIASFFGAIGALAYNYGITFADVSIVAALTFANPLVSTLYAKIVYREKLCTLQYLAILLMIAGIVLISYF